MALTSELFTKDPAVKARLEACAAHNSEHILFGAKGEHVSAIQKALLLILPGLQLPAEELSDKVTGKGFYGPEAPARHPSVLLKLYIYGYLNRIQSNRRLAREACRNFDRRR